MSKSTTRYGGYRREYSAELRASMAKCSNSSGHRRHHLGVALATLLVVLAAVSAAGVVYLNRYEPEATAKAAPSTKLPTTTDKSVDAKTTTIIPYNTTIGFVGDSLTFGCCTGSTPAPELEVADLGDNYRAINRGVNGSTTGDWLDNLLEPAMEEFRNNNVEIVQFGCFATTRTERIVVAHPQGRGEGMGRCVRRCRTIGRGKRRRSPGI